MYMYSPSTTSDVEVTVAPAHEHPKPAGELQVAHPWKRWHIPLVACPASATGPGAVVLRCPVANWSKLEPRRP